MLLNTGTLFAVSWSLLLLLLHVRPSVSTGTHCRLVYYPDEDDFKYVCTVPTPAPTPAPTQTSGVQPNDEPGTTTNTTTGTPTCSPQMSTTAQPTASSNAQEDTTAPTNVSFQGDGSTPTASPTFESTYIGEPEDVEGLGQCEGRCASDDDCKQGLICFIKTAENLFDNPGDCSQAGFLTMNYCYLPEGSGTVSASPTETSSSAPSNTPSTSPTATASSAPSMISSSAPSNTPTTSPTATASSAPSMISSSAPSNTPSASPTATASSAPSTLSSSSPTDAPSTSPTMMASSEPTTPVQQDGLPTSSPTYESAYIGEPGQVDGLGQCEGRCGSDDDCMEGLVCFIKTPDNLFDNPGGCSLAGFATMNYCYLPDGTASSAPSTSGQLSGAPTASPTYESAYIGEPGQVDGLGQCEGRCGSDDDCMEGLVCFIKTPDNLFDNPGGCSLEGFATMNYCYLPDGTASSAPSSSGQLSGAPTASPTYESAYIGEPGQVDGLGQCEGRCGSDDDCMEGLVCFIKTPDNLFDNPGGCSLAGYVTMNYCYLPDDPATGASTAPSVAPVDSVSSLPSASPSTLSESPTTSPTRLASESPSTVPTIAPTDPAIFFPGIETPVPSDSPSSVPSISPTDPAVFFPGIVTPVPSDISSEVPSSVPSDPVSSDNSSDSPSSTPTEPAIFFPGIETPRPSAVSVSTSSPSNSPVTAPPSTSPTLGPTLAHVASPSSSPSDLPSTVPSSLPSLSTYPSLVPTDTPSSSPSVAPTTSSPTSFPTPACDKNGESRFLAMELVLSTLAMSQGYVLSLTDVNNTDALAFEWLSRTDPLHLCADSTNLVQRFVLAALYFALGGETWNECTIQFCSGSSFLDAVDECAWDGVVCRDGEVVEIHLNDRNTEGPLPPVIGLLSSLEVLSMDDNRLTGTLPEALGNLANLRVIDLDNNELVGTIPDSLFNASMLQVIDLDTNRLEGTLSTLVGDIQDLYFLQLDRNYLEGNLPDELGTLTDLKYLSLFLNDFNSSIPETLCGGDVQIYGDCDVCAVADCCQACLR